MFQTTEIVEHFFIHIKKAKQKMKPYNTQTKSKIRFLKKTKYSNAFYWVGLVQRGDTFSIDLIITIIVGYFRFLNLSIHNLSSYSI